MARITAYHRPTSLNLALDLLMRPACQSVVLGGGTTISTAVQTESTEVIDLQSLGLSTIVCERGVARIGATATLQAIATDERLPHVVRVAARNAEPSTLRTLATICGSVASCAKGFGAENEFIASLLVFDASVTHQSRSGAHETELSQVLSNGLAADSIITAVTLSTDGVAVCARTGRTPADIPIVSVIGRRMDDRHTFAASGVSRVPVVFVDAESLDPPGDFRGSAEYRRHLAVELTARVRTALEALT